MAKLFLILLVSLLVVLVSCKNNTDNQARKDEKDEEEKLGKAKVKLEKEIEERMTEINTIIENLESVQPEVLELKYMYINDTTSNINESLDEVKKNIEIINHMIFSLRLLFHKKRGILMSSESIQYYELALNKSSSEMLFDFLEKYKKEKKENEVKPDTTDKTTQQPTQPTRPKEDKVQATINVKKPIIGTEGTKGVTDKKACKQQCAVFTKINPSDVPSTGEKKKEHKEATNKQFSSIGLKINDKGECTCASMSLKLSFFVMGLVLFIRR